KTLIMSSGCGDGTRRSSPPLVHQKPLAGRSTADIALKDAEPKIKLLGVAHRERPATAHRLGGPPLVSWVVVVGGAVGGDQPTGVANSQRLCIHGVHPSFLILRPSGRA